METAIIFTIGLICGRILSDLRKNEQKVFNITISSNANEPADQDAQFRASIDVAEKVTKAIADMDKKGEKRCQM